MYQLTRLKIYKAFFPPQAPTRLLQTPSDFTITSQMLSALRILDQKFSILKQ